MPGDPALDGILDSSPLDGRYGAGVGASGLPAGVNGDQ